MRLTRVVVGTAIAIAVLGGAASAQAATPRLDVLGFSTKYPNDARTVQTGPGGTITRCFDRFVLGTVVNIRNIRDRTPYSVTWTRNGRVVYLTSGLMKEYGSRPTKVRWIFSKTAPLADGPYRFRAMVDGKIRADATVIRNCA